MTERLQGWVKDLRHASRTLRRTPGFTLMTAATLALAIGANAAMFSVVHKVLIDPLPYAHADRLVHIGASAPGTDMPPEFGAANEFFLQYQEQSRLLEDVARTFAEHGANIVEYSGHVEDQMARNWYVAEIGDLKALRALLNSLRNIESVFDAYRVTPS